MSDASYYLYKKQFSYDGTNWFDVQPLTYSYDGDGTMQPVVNTYHDEDCKDNVDYSTQYLTIESLENNNTIYWYTSITSTTRTISASTDNGSTWAEYTTTTGGTEIATLNTGDKVLLKGLNSAYGGDPGDIYFDSSKRYNVYGNIMSLTNGDNFIGVTTINNWSLAGIFKESSGLTSAENLVLPATTLGNYCYDDMFAGCTNLTTAPELPSTTLADGCYGNMFSGCTSLTVAPELPATELVNNCYFNMFRDCTSLTTAPTLPAATLVYQCYMGMFYQCVSLNYIKCLTTDITANRCTYYWGYGVSSTGTFVKDASMSSWTTGDSGIPSGWTVQNA